jgi:hypothetical protein
VFGRYYTLRNCRTGRYTCPAGNISSVRGFSNQSTTQSSCRGPIKSDNYLRKAWFGGDGKTEGPKGPIKTRVLLLKYRFVYVGLLIRVFGTIVKDGRTWLTPFDVDFYI